MQTDLYASHSARLIALGCLIATFIAAGLFGSPEPAAAEDAYGNVFGYDDHRAEQLQQRYTLRAARRSRATSSDDQAVRRRRVPYSDNHVADSTASKRDKNSKKEEAKKIAPQGAIYAIVSLADQHVTVYDSTGRIAQSRISTGMPGHPTPIGLFTILGKERWHRSNIYSGAPMPFMQRITWSGIAMHLGVVPGHPASHGCIRLPDGFAQQFWGMTQIGSRVMVARRDPTPVEISSAFLPVPKLRPAPEVLPGSQQSSLPSSTPVKLASISEASPMSAAAAQETQPSSAAAVKLLNPIDYAKALKERALASKVVSDHAAKNALRSAQVAGAAAQVDRARAALVQAQSREAGKRQVAFAAVRMWKDAVAAAEVAAGTIKEAERRLKPASVLFSKKAGRVFIRQNWKEVYEAPITFKDPDRPIGTHLFIAVSGDADGKLRWSAISVPSGGTPSGEPQRKHSKNDRRADNAPVPQGDRASAALNRVEVADDLRERIAELVWVGAQVIVTDNAPSDEMGQDSDIIVSTH